MIGCDGGCNDWFHGACVNVSQADGENLIERYICPNCERGGKGLTIWKPMCRYADCRKPARLKKTAPSKYCSDEHGEAFMRSQYSKSANRVAGGGVLLPSQLAAVINKVENLESFRQLGDTIPTTEASETVQFTHSEKDRLENIKERLKNIEAQRQLLKDREAFLLVVKDRAKKALGDQKSKKGSAFCGFDDRLSWSPTDYQAWAVHQEVMDLDGQTFFAVLAETELPDGEPEFVCRAKNCPQHPAWSKVQLEDIRYEEINLAEVVAELGEEERDITAGARLRAARRGSHRRSRALHI